jgi:glycosyltransferase involved in cell wall biosynthesis
MTPEAGMQAVTVIFPTLARQDRAPFLQRALASVLSQEGVRAVPLVVINGDERDPDVVRQLHVDPRIRVASVPERGIPEALRAGRDLVDTPWFSRLDDDDLMLPGALALRVSALESQPGLEAVVTNGYRRDATGDTLHVTNPTEVQRDPLTALLTSNWLLPGSWLCRTTSIGSDVFRSAPHSLECTYLAVQLASRRRMVFLGQPTVVWHTDVPASESKSREWHLGEADALATILELDLPKDFREGIRRKIAPACHSAASRFLAEGSPADAWSWHLRSLREPGGWRYLLYTRYVLAALARRRSA